jgi:Flp pilus assembly protein TadD
MSANNQKQQLIVYLGIGLVLLFGAFAADHFVRGVNIFKSKHDLYQKSGSRGEDASSSDKRVMIDAPPQPRPVANRPKNTHDVPESGNIKHNSLMPAGKKYSHGEAVEKYREGYVYDESTLVTEAVYGARFRLAQNQGRREQSVSVEGGGNNSDGDNKLGKDDKPAYFDAPTVQPSKQQTTQTTKGTSANGKSGLVVVRNKETERKLESKLQAGKRALSMGRYDAALSFFNELHRDHSDEPRVLMGRAIALQRLGRGQAAKNAYQALLDNDPDNLHARINMYGIIQKTKPGLALRKLKALREKHPENAELAAQIGLISAKIQKYDQASKYLQIAASITPNNPKHFYNLGIVEEHKGNREKAVQYYEKAVDQIAIKGESGSLSKKKIYDRLATLRDS